MKQKETKKSGAVKTICQNRKARHEYVVGESYEAGIVLTGSEIKSIRAGKVSLQDSYCRVQEGEVFLFDTHIATYDPASRENPDPRRTRKLLLNKREIRQLYAKTRERGFALIPLKIYLKEGLAKVQIAVAKGKRVHEKRDDLRKKDARMEIEKAMKGR